MKDFGSLISKLRKEKGLSQEEFAAAIGCTKQTISNYERNTRKPDYETLEAIADVFNVPMGFFLSKEEQRAKLGRIYRTYNIPASSAKNSEAFNDGSLSDILYISKPSGNMKSDEIRKYLHEVIDQLSDDDLLFMKNLSLRMVRK